MLSTEAAGLAIKIIRCVIKIISRIDVILAEQATAQGPAPFPLLKSAGLLHNRACKVRFAGA